MQSRIVIITPRLEIENTIPKIVYHHHQKLNRISFCVKVHIILWVGQGRSEQNRNDCATRFDRKPEIFPERSAKQLAGYDVRDGPEQPNAGKSKLCPGNLLPKQPALIRLLWYLRSEVNNSE